MVSVKDVSVIDFGDEDRLSVIFFMGAFFFYITFMDKIVNDQPTLKLRLGAVKKPPSKLGGFGCRVLDGSFRRPELFFQPRHDIFPIAFESPFIIS